SNFTESDISEEIGNIFCKMSDSPIHASIWEFSQESTTIDPSIFNKLENCESRNDFIGENEEHDDITSIIAEMNANFEVNIASFLEELGEVME
ncbi:hypothetical protein PFISCL1PPCAC_11139, partial [Pristionchus fissidentatus]